jgi:bifunctional UDP-N-acetylglucosamine pyrophosphorylase/glucosamine-1-phosphate N-acetyltransferase
MKSLAAIVLAAGKGTRMKSATPKVLHGVAGLPMLHYPLDVLKGLKAGPVVVVVGSGAEEVKAAFPLKSLTYVMQAPQLGTGHAALCASRALRGFKGDVLILSGDVPLITEDTLKALVKTHRMRGGAEITLVTTVLEDPAGYGRVLRDARGVVEGVVEDRDASPAEKGIKEINAGIYLVRSDFLLRHIRTLGSENAQGEYYLPDLIGMAAKTGGRAASITVDGPDEVMGINNRVELARADSVMRGRINRALMLSGVTLIDPLTTYIDRGVEVGPDTVIRPGAHLLGKTCIGRRCAIGEWVSVRDSEIGDGSTINAFSVIESSRAGSGVVIGPFARLRPGNVIGDNARIGNFVEVKKTRMGRGTKANHLSYLGDSVIGSDVNIGAGTITCNYDGVHKHTTIIEDRAFIGSDTQLVAPVTVGEGAYVGSGTTVTKDVPPWSLVITRAPERVIKGWARKKGIKGCG